MTERPRQGLFAFDGDDLHIHYQDEPELDHVQWFEKIGIPSSGPAYDAILRGKVILDEDVEQQILAFYGTAFLSNQRYTRIVELFNLDEAKIVERVLNEPY